MKVHYLSPPSASVPRGSDRIKTLCGRKANSVKECSDDEYIKEITCKSCLKRMVKQV